MADLRVLLFSPLEGRDPPSGDISYTGALLDEPPPGVRYTTYQEALDEGSLRIRGRKPWHAWRDFDPGVFAARALELGLRRATAAFREPFWFVSIEPGRFDLLHQHLFAIHQVGPRLPVVSSAGYPLTELYRIREGWGEAHLRLALALQWTFDGLFDVHDPWLRPSGDAPMIVYTPHFRDWLIARGVPAEQLIVGSTALPDLGLPAKRSDGFTLAIVARDFVRKGGDIALAAFRELHRDDPRWRLIIATRAGDARQNNLHAEPGIEVLVDPSRATVLKELLPATDILLAPTRGDCGAPYAMLEALQAGTCIITASELAWLDPRLVEPPVKRTASNPAAVASAARELAAGDMRASQRAARELWRSGFSMGVLHERLLEAYELALIRERAARAAPRRRRSPRRAGR
jgi:glycosyltransferase involved in cell wall biosynthesis